MVCDVFVEFCSIFEGYFLFFICIIDVFLGWGIEYGLVILKFVVGCVNGWVCDVEKFGVCNKIWNVVIEYEWYIGYVCLFKIFYGVW